MKKSSFKGFISPPLAIFVTHISLMVYIISHEMMGMHYAEYTNSKAKRTNSRTSVVYTDMQLVVSYSKLSKVEPRSITLFKEEQANLGSAFSLYSGCS